MLTCLPFPGAPRAGDRGFCRSTDVCCNPLFTTKPGTLEAKEMAAARVAKLISGHRVSRSMSGRNGSTPGESLLLSLENVLLLLSSPSKPLLKAT